MEREAKKRKLEYTDEEGKGKEGDEDDEEEKMEKFFALLRSTKRMHDQLRRNSNRIFKDKEKIKKVGEGRVSVAWNPSFLPEDFLEEDGRDSPAAAAGGPSKRKEEEKKEEGEEGSGLDLKLSL
ncbi:PROTEIN NIM1-INTERACTING 3 [Salix koriyanagi]|uniref:PROTEIN NIM1-INTERACTING 3 n=1 Tax=Salix koriyanagi TaxID=2511006 RepID=A0A9Q0P7Q8_9ROSI|nr:PROTEIN NIM1-INTERACTING 3 [Salix koriyanagi]